MRIKKIFCMGGIFIIFSLLLGGSNSWADPLVINYSKLSMSCGTPQNLSASGGCPPFTWRLFGGGTLTSSGSYTAPASNPNCTNNAMIVLTDSCGNMTSIKIAVNGYNPESVAYRFCDELLCYCHTDHYSYHATYGQWDYGCNGTLVGTVFWDGNGREDFQCYGGWWFGCEVGTCDQGSCIQPGNCSGICWAQTCGTYRDMRTDQMKEQGCCPLSPETGEPLDGGFPGSEALGKGVLYAIILLEIL